MTRTKWSLTIHHEDRDKHSIISEDQIQQFRGAARDHERETRKNLSSENSQNGKADGNSGVPHSTTT